MGARAVPCTGGTQGCAQPQVGKTLESELAISKPIRPLPRHHNDPYLVTLHHKMVLLNTVQGLCTFQVCHCLCSKRPSAQGTLTPPSSPTRTRRHVSTASAGVMPGEQWKSLRLSPESLLPAPPPYLTVSLPSLMDHIAAGTSCCQSVCISCFHSSVFISGE